MAKLDKSVRISQKTQNRPPVSYGDSAWGDLLTSFKGCTISYDEIGNPENLYLRGRDYVMTWTAGRRLAAMTNSAGNEFYTYTYNDEGIRTSKTAYGTTHNYLLSGSQIIAENLGNKLLVYLYDENGSPMGMQYRTSSMAENTFYTFWFEKNLQGDIIAVYNESGTKLITYTYDAWGNVAEAILNHSGNNLYATYNPFRYRGYYYDTETKLYYLQSRYYSPEMGRFINADGYASTGTGLIGYNMFAYCNNNPIMYIDDSGSWPSLGQIVAATAIIAIAAVAVVAIVCSAGAAGAAIGAGAAVYFGASAATATAVANVATIGCYAVAAGISACALSDAGEVLTGTNVIRDVVLNGNQDAYGAVETTLNVVTCSIIQLGASNQGMSTEISRNVDQTINKLLDSIGSKLTESRLFSHKDGAGFSIGSTAKNGRGRIELLYRYKSGPGGTFISINNNDGRSIFRIDWDPKDGFHIHRR